MTEAIEVHLGTDEEHVLHEELERIKSIMASSGVRKMSRRRSLWSARRWRTICWAQAQRRIHHGTVLQYCKENSSRAQVELIVELIVELTVELYSTVSTDPVTRPRPTDVVEHSQLQYTPHVRRRCFYSMQKS